MDDSLRRYDDDFGARRSNGEERSQRQFRHSGRQRTDNEYQIRRPLQNEGEGADVGEIEGLPDDAEGSLFRTRGFQSDYYRRLAGVSGDQGQELEEREEEPLKLDSWRPSDEQIKEEIYVRLRDDSWVDESRISVDVRDGKVSLFGEVPDRQTKFRAEVLLDDVSGIVEVVNDLEYS